MKKWLDEEYEFQVEVTGYLHGDTPERYCRNGEEIGDVYRCTYGCPVNGEGCGICSKVMLTLFPLMETVRGGGDLDRLVPPAVAAYIRKHQLYDRKNGK